MKHPIHLIAAILALLLQCKAAFPQQINVDRPAITFYDGQQTLRVLQYPEPAPGNNKIYRLETLPENGFPAITLQSSTQAGVVTFEDKFPYDNVYNDNASPFLSLEGAQSLYSFQSVMKAIDARFGWKGLDGTGIAPINIVMGNTQKYPLAPSSAYYVTDGSIDWFFLIKDFNGATSFNNGIETIAHEYLHSIMRYKRGFQNYNPDICGESHSVEEGIADLFGVYIRNKVKQIPPQNFDWEYQEWENLGASISDPKSFLFPDTYNGQYYKNECHPAFLPHPNGGVLFKWSYLLSEGFQGSAYNDLGYGYSNLTGIGVEKCFDILWATLPKLNKYLTYPVLRIKTLETAGQLYGLNSTEYLAVQNAWCAVGVCDNNLPAFTMSPANATSFINPWPTVDLNLTWTNNNLIQEWEVQMSPKYDFSDSVQTVKLTNFSTVIGQNQTLMSTATATGYFHPSKKVYARAKISQAGVNFCKGLNPLCNLYQKFGPTHAFGLKDQKVQFWPATTFTSVKAWSGQVTWKSISGAERYRLQVSNDSSFSALVYDGISLHTGNYMETGIINTSLTIGQTYYARVRAERLDLLKLKNNHGAWSNMLTVTAVVPSTAIIQAKSQMLNDPPLQVSTLGRQVNWDYVAGATNFVVQIAKDNAFSNIVSSVSVAGNLASTTMLFPILPNLTELFVRVLPQKVTASGTVSGVCSNVWRIKINETAALPVMTGPLDGSTFPFKSFAGNVFEWKSGTVNMNTVDHFELHLTKTAGPASIFTTQGKTLNFFVQDPLMFDATGLQAKVLAVNPLGAKTGLSLPFNYIICPDHPAVFFPGDLGKVDPTKDFKVEWFKSESFAPGSQFLVTLKEAGINALPGFTDKPTTANFMLVPAGTLTNGKNYTVTVKNSSSCAALLLPVTFFSAVGSGGSNQPQPPKLVNFNVELKGFRNDPDAFSIGTSNYELGLEFIDPDGNVLALLDPNGMQVTKLLVDSENSGVVLTGSNKPQGKYKLRLKLAKIFPPNTYYPFDQPRFSVFLNGQAIILNHIITIDLFNPGSSFDQWKEGFQFADIILDIK
ncbi:M4 family metallopeptidase [Dyadobacter fermentans]|uniref:M4 family metallopeptidase n=1 Tax=Dyadobacter fermentans TaxID=94254 RepID=UPI001CBF6A1A|nr:M4 family metallopeptidase [Dyadobacter fermentans]MBZ1361184.1 M4 family metallopeptidase [Dyadobacter fermentans]